MKDSKPILSRNANSEDDNFDDDNEELIAQKKKRDEIKREIMELQREMKGMKDKKAKQQKEIDNSTKEPTLTAEETKNDMLLSYHQEQEKYAANRVPKKGLSREEQTMAMLAKFKQKLGMSFEWKLKVIS